MKSTIHDSAQDASAAKPIERAALGGIFIQKPRWGFSFKGWCLAGLFGGLLLAVLMLTIHPFLSQNNPVESKSLVVEAWLPEYGLHEAARIYKTGGYDHLYLTGGPFRGSVDPDSDDTYPHRAQQYFRKQGLTNAIPITFYHVNRDRTFNSATSLRNYLERGNQPLKSFNIITLGPHARRSRLLFQKAFGKETKVGVISLRNREYENSRWWRHSEGVKEVFSEGIAFLYSAFVFSPTSNENSAPKKSSLNFRNN
ncbi:MAG: hypothetical protein ACO1QB_08515 [Verrucomicrobiales bacterium]